MIRIGREGLNLSQRQAADLLKSLDVSADGSDFSRWENGLRKPSIDQGNALVMTLRLNAYEFWRALGVRFAAPASVRTLPPELVSLWPSLSPDVQQGVLALARAAARTSGREAGEAS